MVFSSGVIVFLTLFSAIGFANGKFAIVKPWPPENAYPAEFTSTQVTCIAYDSEGIKVPESIQFVRKNNFALYTNLTANENIYFTNKTEGGKLFVTFHIRNVTMADDSQSALGRYECHAYAVGDPHQMVKRGFTLNVVRSHEIPKLLTSKLKVLQHGKEGRIYCNITDKGSQANQLRRMLWFKDDELVQNIPVATPGPDKKQAEFNAFVITNVGVKDAGKYTCVLEAFVRQKEYNVTDDTTVNIAPWIEHLKGENEAHIGENLTLQCSPQGVPMPLNVEWKVKKENDENVTACVDSSTDKRYKISHNGTYDPYLLSIANLSSTDSGDYYCCLPSNCSTNTAEDLCQKLTVTFEDDVISDGTKILASWGVVLTMVAFFVFRFHF